MAYAFHVRHKIPRKVRRLHNAHSSVYIPLCTCLLFKLDILQFFPRFFSIGEIIFRPLIEMLLFATNFLQ